MTNKINEILKKQGVAYALLTYTFEFYYGDRNKGFEYIEEKETCFDYDDVTIFDNYDIAISSFEPSFKKFRSNGNTFIRFNTARVITILEDNKEDFTLLDDGSEWLGVENFEKQCNEL